MPKQKTNKAAAKRLKKTATGKIKHARANTGHLMTCKSSKRKRHLRGKRVLCAAEAKKYATLIPN